MKTWSVREAKDHLSELLNAAEREPQVITRRGQHAGVVLSEAEYKRLRRRQEPLSQFFARAGDPDIEIERVKASIRDEGEI